MLCGLGLFLSGQVSESPSPAGPYFYFLMFFLFLISFYSEFLFILILQFLQGFMFFSNGLILIGFC